MADKFKKKNMGAKSKINKKNETKKSSITSNWFYMSQEAISVKEIKTVLEDTDYEMEIWEEVGVLEIVLGEAASMDIEAGEEDLEFMFEDEYSREFLKKNQIETAFYVTIKSDAYEEAKKAMVTICGKLGGFFCGDTEDFMPKVL